MKQYLDIMNTILNEGVTVTDRTGVGRKKIVGTQSRFKMADGFPLLTTNRTSFKLLALEILWMLTGSDDNGVLKKENCHIWDNWEVTEKTIDAFIDKYLGDHDQAGRDKYKEALTKTHLNKIGSIYGPNWRFAQGNFNNSLVPEISESDFAPDRRWKVKKYYEQYKTFINSGIEAKLLEVGYDKKEITEDLLYQVYLKDNYYSVVDQMYEVIKTLRTRPYSSRIIVNSWIPGNLPFEGLPPDENVMLNRGALAPCHVLQQYVALPPDKEGGKMRLTLQMFQRSVDTPVGCPFNIAEYALLLHMVAQVVNMEPYEFIYTTGDTHIYTNQIELAKEHVKRTPTKLPTLNLNPYIKDLFKFTLEDMEIVGYNPHPDKIKYPVAI